MPRRDVVAAIVLIALGIAYAHLTSGLPERTLPNTPGPSFFPWLIVASLLALSVAMLARGLRAGKRAGKKTAPPPWRALGMLGWFVAYLAALPVVGFVIASVPFFAGLMVFFGARRWASVAALSVIVPVAVYHLFRGVFQVLLPAGPW